MNGIGTSVLGPTVPIVLAPMGGVAGGAPAAAEARWSEHDSPQRPKARSPPQRSSG